MEMFAYLYLAEESKKLLHPYIFLQRIFFLSSFNYFCFLTIKQFSNKNLVAKYNLIIQLDFKAEIATTLSAS